jgi:hypothetical protein
VIPMDTEKDQAPDSQDEPEEKKPEAEEAG